MGIERATSAHLDVERRSEVLPERHAPCGHSPRLVHGRADEHRSPFRRVAVLDLAGM